MAATTNRSGSIGRVPAGSGEVVGSSPISYTKAVQALMVASLTSNQDDRVRISGAAHWFVGVKANISDCLSDATGSIPVRTAKNC